MEGDQHEMPQKVCLRVILNLMSFHLYFSCPWIFDFHTLYFPPYLNILTVFK